MKILILLIIMFGYGCLLSVEAEAAEYGVVQTPAPILNRSDFNAIFGGAGGIDLKTDRCGQVRELEFIALPGSILTLLNKQRAGTADIYQIETSEYVALPGTKLYVDGRFIHVVRTAPGPRQRVLPSRNKVIVTLRTSVGSPYVWGGNVLSGIPELTKWFYKGVDNDSRLTLAGLDCSGLLYHATNGWTPRNTSQLISFGQGVVIAGMQAEDIAKALQPLDLIVWNGHVVIVLDRQTTIESRLACGKPGNGGVVTTPLMQRLTEVMRTRRPVDVWPPGQKHQDCFVVRRWYPQE